MCVNQGKLNEAVNAYEKAVSLSRTILDAENSIMGLEAAKAQMAAIARIK
jgi:exonuclease VII small subunit